MRVNCENCDTNFNLDEGLVKSAGSKVRCSKCKHIFVVYPPPPVAEEPAEDGRSDAEEKAPFGGASFDTQEQLDGGTGEEDDVAAVEDTGAEASEGPDMPEEPEFDEVSPGDTEAGDLDLSDIEKMLDAGDEPEDSDAAGEEALPDADTGEDADSLDLSDIEKILDVEDDSDDLMEEKVDEDQELVFDLDEEIELESGVDQISPATELDLGDLEKMFESEEELEPSTIEEPETGGDLGIPDLEEEGMGEGLDLQLEEEPPEVAPEDMDEMLDLDLGSEEEASSLLLSDEGDTPVTDIEPDIEVEEGDLILEEGADSEGLDLDLAPETEASDSGMEGLGLELEPETEMSDSDDAEGAIEEEPLEEIQEMALGDLDAQPEEVGEISEALLATEAGEDEMAEVEENGEMDYPDDAIPDIPDEEEDFGEEADVLGEEQAVEREMEEDFEEVEPVATRGGGVKKLLGLLAVVVVILLLLVALLFLHHKGIFNVPYLDRVPLPFLSEQTTVGGSDLGNLKIKTSNVNSRFLDSEKAGRLFVVTGTVKNEYIEPRSHIKVSGSLYTRDKTLADTATAYCGNVIADLELSQMTPAAIRTRLGNQSGDNNTNENVKAGEERPFMVIFFELPESLDEFTVTVLESSAAGK